MAKRSLLSERPSYFYLYFHQHVSASNPAIFRVMFLM